MRTFLHTMFRTSLDTIDSVHNSLRTTFLLRKASWYGIKWTWSTTGVSYVLCFTLHTTFRYSIQDRNDFIVLRNIGRLLLIGNDCIYIPYKLYLFYTNVPVPGLDPLTTLRFKSTKNEEHVPSCREEDPVTHWVQRTRTPGIIIHTNFPSYRLYILSYRSCCSHF